jgi:hypothetical protein
MPSPATIVRPDYLGALSAAEPDYIEDLVEYGVERRWWPELVAAVQRESWLATDVVRHLPRKHRASLYDLVAASGTRTADAVHIINAAIRAGDVDQAARILASHPSAAQHSDIVDVLSDQVRYGDHDAAIPCCRVGVSPFPFVFGLPDAYLDAHRAWISVLLADHHPTPAQRRRRILLIAQAAAEAGVLTVAGGRDFHCGKASTSVHRAATAPHVGGLMPDHEPLTWLANAAIHAGAAMRDKRFAAAMKMTAAAHAGLTEHLGVLAALACTPTATVTT